MSDSYYDPVETDFRERKFEKRIAELEAEIERLNDANAELLSRLSDLEERLQLEGE
jgi:prefoldin subunit 5